jgi:hypothetical protein
MAMVPEWTNQSSVGTVTWSVGETRGLFDKQETLKGMQMAFTLHNREYFSNDQF